MLIIVHTIYKSSRPLGEPIVETWSPVIQYCDLHKLKTHTAAAVEIHYEGSATWAYARAKSIETANSYVQLRHINRDIADQRRKERINRDYNA